MKSGTYNRYYKLGLEHFVNKHLMKLQKPNVTTDMFYISLMTAIIAGALIFS